MAKLTRAHRSAIAAGVSAYWRQVREVQRQTGTTTDRARAAVSSLRARGIRSAYATRQHPRITSRAVKTQPPGSTPATERAIARESIPIQERDTYREFVSEHDGPKPGEFDSLDEYHLIRDYFGDFDIDLEDYEVEANADYEETAS